MVAKTVNLPNIRKLFIPSPDHYIAEVDLSGADAQVVAWEAGDEDLKEAFRKGMKVHIKNARDVFPDKIKGWSDEAIKATDFPGGIYHDCKRAVHATNYVVGVDKIAYTLGWTRKEASNFQKLWFGLHPNIRKWHRHVQECLWGRVEGNPPRTVKNKFGFRIVYFDRIEGLLPEALAWIPQSTVAINRAKGGIELRKKCPWVQLLLEVHDSLVFQFHKDNIERLNEIKKALHSIIIPYDDPLCIPWGLKLGTKSWGDAPTVQWSTGRA